MTLLCISVGYLLSPQSSKLSPSERTEHSRKAMLRSVLCLQRPQVSGRECPVSVDMADANCSGGNSKTKQLSLLVRDQGRSLRDCEGQRPRTKAEHRDRAEAGDFLVKPMATVSAT